MAKPGVQPPKKHELMVFKVLLVPALLLTAAGNASTAVRYVDANSASPSPPYTDWATAAATIQDAIDASSAGDEIVVTNGIYQTGGRAVYGTMTNRVAVTKPVTVRSVNGPQFTVIRGRKVPGTTNGDGAVRCVYLTNGAVLVGFTLTNGATRASGDLSFEQSGGGVFCASANAVVSNCTLTGNSANSFGGGASGGTLYNCTLTANSASSGGGAFDGTLNNCTLTGNSSPSSGGGAASGTLNNCALTGNSAQYGGGAYSATLNNCTLTGNSARLSGGGASFGRLTDCTLAGNSAGDRGGGAYGGTLRNCTVMDNSAQDGGGASGGFLYNCTLMNNSAQGGGGGAAYSTLNNCTITGNSAQSGGGAVGGTLNNCVVYYNTVTLGSGHNYSGGTLNYCCTTPLPPSGTGNLTAEPQLASASRLSAGSPCRGAGSAAYASGVDIDGEPWANPPSIGCDEYYTGALTGPLTVAIEASHTNVATGFVVDFRAQIGGRVSASRWEFGDGTVASNQPYASHSWDAAGDFAMVLRAYNESFPEGISAALTVHVVESPVHYVALDSSTPVAPYASWTTAARTIQDAVDAATLPGSLVLVSNGFYQTGGRAVRGIMTNRVAITKPVTVRSVNGPEVTAIQGYQVPGTTNGDDAIRCVYLTNGSLLVGFTLTNGATRASGDYTFEQCGGGVWCESSGAVVSNCTLVGNFAQGLGGGASSGTLNNCTLMGNSARYSGGGGAHSTLNTCTLTGNSAEQGGGSAYGTLNHCVLSRNSADSGGGTAYGVLNRCTLTDNSASSGGGVSGGMLNNCTLAGNSADYAGGASGGTLNNCTLMGNWADYDGGGAAGGTLNNCTVAGNSADYGGGVTSGTLNNCTLTGNSALREGGGAYASKLNNCIVYYNTTKLGFGPNYYSGTFNYCCTTPLPPSGTGNLSAEPQLASASHLSENSPCRGAGSVTYASRTDIDGEPWANPPSIGCDEYYSGGSTGPLTVAIDASHTNLATGFVVEFRARINGRASASLWEYGDATVSSNQPYASHSWAAAGVYVVVLRAYNESYPEGASAALTVHVVEQPVHYVALDSSTPVAPYGMWATAARTIQDAVDAATMVGALVLVSNGVYQTGGRTVYGTLTNRVAVTKPVTVQSVNGPDVTAIQGYQVPGTTNGDSAVRCVYLTNEAALVGFTLTHGATRAYGDLIREQSGGGVLCESTSPVVSNCTFTGNSARTRGGAAYQGTLNGCTLTGNSAYDAGGGAYQGTLNSCTLLGNWAPFGGGASRGALNDCILAGNSAFTSGGGTYQGILNHCTLTSNSAQLDGGGAMSGTLNHCTLMDNSARNGGGANSGTLINCILTGNSAYYGGGVSSNTLNNCTLAGNWAEGEGGGAYYSALNNCIVHYNTAPTRDNYRGPTLNYCCTMPLPSGGMGNFTNAPLFVDEAGSNLRLQSVSPCINAGRNAYTPSGPDFDGFPRIVGGTVDVGAHEFQSPQSVLSYAWLQQYGLPTDGSADYADGDGDQFVNWEEWHAGTNPTNSLSVLRLLAPVPGPSGVEVTWRSLAGVLYFLERSTNLGVAPIFLPWAKNIVGLPGTTTLTDGNAFGAGAVLYRVGVQD